MATRDLLTGDDLDGLGHLALSGDEPLAIAERIVGAVETGRLADPSDTVVCVDPGR